MRSTVAALAILGTLAAAITGCGLSTSKASPNADKNEQAAESSEKTFKVGQKAKDGDFTFTVLKVRRGVKHIGDSFMGEKAKGEFVLVKVKVANHGDQEGTMFDTNQKLIDSKGREYEATSNWSSDTTWEDINPGLSITGEIAFDVPKGTKIKAVELHDSAFSGGVTVKL